MYRPLLFQTTALALLLGLAGQPALASEHANDGKCNVLRDSEGDPVKSVGNLAIGHANTNDCKPAAPKNDAYSAKAPQKKKTPQVAEKAEKRVAAATPVPAPVLDPLTVYFDVNSDSLSKGSKAQLRDFADLLLVSAPKRVQVAGYTDTSGSLARNKRLSKSRAANVIASLISAGVPARVIAQDARGEKDLAVKTPDSTREKGNRRVTITPVY